MSGVMEMNKRGQLSLFIIIGIVVVASLGSYIYFKSSLEKLEVTPEILAAQEAPLAFSPITVFIEGCIRTVSHDALVSVGGKGGYNDLENNGIAPGIYPTEGSGVSLIQGSELVIPYWFYLKDNNGCTGTCSFDSKQPLLSGNGASIERQIESYINDNLGLCFDNFKNLKSKGYQITTFNEVRSKVTITEEGVLVAIDYPIEAKSVAASYDRNKFAVTIPVKLKEIYDIASMVTELEAQNKFLENHALNLIVAFSGKDKNKLPPMSDTGLEFGSNLYWTRSKVKQDLQGMLASYIPLLRMEGTRNYRPISFPGEPLKESLFNQQMTIPGETYYPLDISFRYLSWEPYVDLNCNGEICQPESVSTDTFALFGLQRYNFVYDLSFPVLVEITDPDAFAGKGYTFRFMLEANIRNNKAMESEFNPIDGIQPELSMMCDPDKRNSGDITVGLKDSISGNPIDNAMVTYSCGNEGCFIGRSEQGQVESGFPICLGGVVSASKKGYISQSRNINTRLDINDEISLDLSPIIEKEFVIQKKRVVKNPEGWKFIDSPVGFGNKESAFLSLTRMPEEGESEYATAVEYTGGKGTLSLAPGEYEVEIIMYTDELIVIPEHEECVDVFLSEDCYTLDKLEFSGDFPNGGVKLNHTFTVDDLNKDTLVFYAVNPFIEGIPEQARVIEDLDQVDKVDEYSTEYATFLSPRVE